MGTCALRASTRCRVFKVLKGALQRNHEQVQSRPRVLSEDNVVFWLLRATCAADPTEPRPPAPLLRFGLLPVDRYPFCS